jgi:hypothetical protein
MTHQSLKKTEIIFATPNEGKQLIEQHDRIYRTF